MSEYKEYKCGECGHKVNVYGFEIKRVSHSMYGTAYAYHDELCKCRKPETVTLDGKIVFRKADGIWKTKED